MAVIYDGLNVDPIGRGERVVFPNSQGINIAFHDKSKGVNYGLTIFHLVCFLNFDLETDS